MKSSLKKIQICIETLSKLRYPVIVKNIITPLVQNHLTDHFNRQGNSVGHIFTLKFKKKSDLF